MVLDDLFKDDYRPDSEYFDDEKQESFIRGNNDVIHISELDLGNAVGALEYSMQSLTSEVHSTYDTIYGIDAWINELRSRIQNLEETVYG